MQLKKIRLIFLPSKGNIFKIICQRQGLLEIYCPWAGVMTQQLKALVLVEDLG